MSAPRWLAEADERMARAAWSRLAEPGDLDAVRFVAAHGALAALSAVYSSDAAVTVIDRPSRGGQVGKAVVASRWRVRAGDTDPRQDLTRLARFSGRVVIPGDAEWPPGLDDLQDRAPFCLWARGPASLTSAMDSSVSLVGARAATWYGERVTSEIAVGCAAAAVTVVSGAAYGIDATAHRAVLQADGLTLAVLACGVDRGYPRGNERLIETIAHEGALVSEVPPGCAPSRWRFLERNRLIAALTRGTVVVEAAWRSGAQGTARHALELGRQVGAVPGPVTSSMSAGCHRLLRQGATCVTDAAEVIELVSPLGAKSSVQPELFGAGGESPAPGASTSVHDGLSPAEIRILDAIPLRSPATVEAISRIAGLPPAQVLAGLGRLEARRLADYQGGRWCRCR